MAWIKRSVLDVVNEEAPRLALDIIADFLFKTLSASGLAAGANTGNGTILGYCATEQSVVETVTVTCTTGGPSASFSVVGSVSGAMPSATINTPYSDKVSMVISGGSVDFVASDSFTFTVGASTSPWSSLFQDTDNLHLSGAGYPVDAPPGPIYVRLEAEENQLTAQGGTSYDSGSNVLQGTTHAQSAPVLKSGFDFYCISTPQSVKITCISGSGRYTSLYLGFINTPATDVQYTYPLCIGGTGTELYTSPTDLEQYWRQQQATTARVQIFDGYNYVPSGTQAAYIKSFPIEWLNLKTAGLSPNGKIDLFPVTVLGSLTNNYLEGKVFGDYEGLYSHTSDSGLIIPESIVTYGTKALLTVPNTNDATELVSMELLGDL